MLASIHWLTSFQCERRAPPRIGFTISQLRRLMSYLPLVNCGLRAAADHIQERRSVRTPDESALPVAF